MLAARNRLKHGRDIARVFSRGRYGASGPISIKAAPTSLTESRAVVVVSKKVSKRATVRNRIRRRLVAILADEWATVAPGYDIVITVREDIEALPASQLRTDLVGALQKARLPH